MGTTPTTVANGPSLDRLVAEGSPDVHTVTTVDGVYRYASTGTLGAFGWEPRDLVGKREDSFLHPDDVTVDGAADGPAAKAPDRMVAVRRFRCADGTYRWTEALSRLVAWDGETVVVSAVRDIGPRKESELDLRRRAMTDPLTGIANRGVFMDRLEHALRRLDRHAGLVAVLFLDLDHFKLINDSVGHRVGDAVLLQMAERLLAFIRPQDTLARLGGDEFAVVVEDMSWISDAMALGTRIIEAGRQPFLVGDDQCVCTMSVGIAVTQDAHRNAEDLLQEADLALYRAKDRGRDRAEVFDEELRTRAVGRLGTERMLRRAIAEDRLRVEFQPIVDLRTGSTVAAEALVRVWDPSEPELVAADSFITVAEETGLLGPMDDWVLHQAIDQAATWRQRFAGRDFTEVAVNVTARGLADPRFVQTVIDDLRAHDLPTGALQVEVTERVLMEASNSTMTALKVLRDAGVRVGLDDFGTGYSSLSYLRLFPIDFVKIDQSFIQELRSQGTERAIVASVIDLAHALGMRVIAEGVETAAQLRELTILGCDRAQGFLFSPAAPAEAMEGRVLHARSDAALAQLPGPSTG